MTLNEVRQAIAEEEDREQQRNISQAAAPSMSLPSSDQLRTEKPNFMPQEEQGGYYRGDFNPLADPLSLQASHDTMVSGMNSR